MHFVSVVYFSVPIVVIVLVPRLIPIYYGICAAVLLSNDSWLSGAYSLQFCDRIDSKTIMFHSTYKMAFATFLFLRSPIGLGELRNTCCPHRSFLFLVHSLRTGTLWAVQLG